MVGILSQEYVFIPLAVLGVLGVTWAWGKLRGSYNPFSKNPGKTPPATPNKEL